MSDDESIWDSFWPWMCVGLLIPPIGMGIGYFFAVYGAG